MAEQAIIEHEGEERRVPAGRVDASNLTPMQMAYQLINGGADLGSVKEMLAVSRELAAEQARRAFDKAVAAAKSEIPIIAKNATGHQNKRYADFSAYAQALKPILAKHGLSYRFRSDQSDSRILVTCVLSHEEGHSEENSLSGPADQSGSKNAIQAIGSTLTYLQRYTLIQALGLAAGDDDDDDGIQAGSAETVSDEQVLNLRDLITEVKADEKKFAKFMGVDSLDQLPAKKYQAAVDELRAFEKRSA